MKPKKKTIIDREKESLSMLNDYAYKGMTIYEIATKYKCTPQWVAKLVTKDLSETFRKLHSDNRIERLYNKLKNLA